MVESAAKKGEIKNTQSGETFSSLRTSTLDESMISRISECCSYNRLMTFNSILHRILLFMIKAFFLASRQFCSYSSTFFAEIKKNIHFLKSLIIKLIIPFITVINLLHQQTKTLNSLLCYLNSCETCTNILCIY